LSPSLSGPRIALLPGRAGLAAAGPARVAAHPEAGWNGALRALEDLLGQGKAGGRAQVILSHHFVRLFLLDPPPAWLNDREMPAWIADRLAEPLGGTTGWRFAWDATPPGAAIPVAAGSDVAIPALGTAAAARVRALAARDADSRAEWEPAAKDADSRAEWEPAAKDADSPVLYSRGGRSLPVRAGAIRVRCAKRRAHAATDDSRASRQRCSPRLCRKPGACSRTWDTHPGPLLRRQG